MFHVFHRTWWIDNQKWPEGLEPKAGEKHTLEYCDTEEEARRVAKEWNRRNSPGKYSDKAEIEEC